MHCGGFMWAVVGCASVVLATVFAPHAHAAETVWPVPDWQVAAPDTQGLSAEGVEKVKTWMKDDGSKTGLMVRHGRIVGEWYFDDAQPTSKYLVYSTSKSFASTAVGIAVAEGKLKLDSTVGEFLPEVKPAEKRQITVRDLISMTAGVFNDGKFHERKDQFTFALNESPVVAPPGSKWDYNNTGLALLSPVMQKATGKPIDEYLAEKLFRPIGIKNEDWSWDKCEDVVLPYSGLHITARGLARFGLLFLNQGRWQDAQLVPAAWVKEATSPSQNLNKEYGYLWWTNANHKWPGVPTDAFASLGHLDNNMLVVPSLDLIVLRQVGSDAASNKGKNMGELWKLAVEAVVDAK